MGHKSSVIHGILFFSWGERFAHYKMLVASTNKTEKYVRTDRRNSFIRYNWTYIINSAGLSLFHSFVRSFYDKLKVWWKLSFFFHWLVDCRVCGFQNEIPPFIFNKSLAMCFLLLLKTADTLAETMYHEFGRFFLFCFDTSCEWECTAREKKKFLIDITSHK